MLATGNAILKLLVKRQQTNYRISPVIKAKPLLLWLTRTRTTGIHQSPANPVPPGIHLPLPLLAPPS